jgi:hypothetical protein
MHLNNWPCQTVICNNVVTSPLLNSAATGRLSQSRPSDCAAEKYAREQVRHGGAVTCIEVRERGNGSVVLWRAT